ncbi:prepilin-type N-terminal cleavage/methylation domain-containing protein [Acinetobacter wuhouensis]|uniref:PilW family protein n=1 Tax=Acinetobacter wuhouensis TaxID=1879050 RepID=UPI001022D753|nr:PilW family protein [Acinetobacter wuhouensis]RZG72676.1 prepilin-type N-terminal cleavage/methylation domain-containing protein [Acinetobacter wuhouensis]
MKNKNIQGFTLVELMIALTLGLILVAVAIQLLISGQVNYKIQQAASTVQDSGVFSLNAVTKNIRLANHGNSGALNDETLYGGIVLSSQTTTGKSSSTASGNLNNLKNGTTLITGDGYISKNAYTDSAFGSIKSDQLVIIYQAPMDMVTCTGRRVKGPNRNLTSLTKGWYVIEKYYIKKSTTDAKSDLYCSDALFVAKNEVVPQTLGTGTNLTRISSAETLNTDYGSTSGQMVAQNVDYMRVQLIVRNADNTIGTMGINNYTGITITNTLQHRPAVIGVNIGWLVRSNETVPNLENVTYKVLDQSFTAPNDKFMRHVYSTTIAIRNGGLGDIIQ